MFTHDVPRKCVTVLGVTRASEDGVRGRGLPNRAHDGRESRLVWGSGRGTGERKRRGCCSTVAGARGLQRGCKGVCEGLLHVGCDSWTKDSSAARALISQPLTDPPVPS